VRKLARFSLLLVFALFATVILASVSSTPPAHAAPSTVSGGVTVFSATWCSACSSLRRALDERSIPYDLVDVDRSPSAYAKARERAGTNSIPLTQVKRSGDERWIVGADPEAVERAYRGD
jgi:glutaredoxin